MARTETILEKYVPSADLDTHTRERVLLTKVYEWSVRHPTHCKDMPAITLEQLTLESTASFKDRCEMMTSR